MNRTLFYSFVGLTLSFGFVCAYADKPNGGINDTCLLGTVPSASCDSIVNIVKGEVVDSVPVELTKQHGEETIYESVDVKPSFPGGNLGLQKWLVENLNYPIKAAEKKIEGRVVISFIVCKDGSIIEPKIVQSVHPLLDNEALRIDRIMPQWIPGKLNGVAVNVRYTTPLTFKLQ